MKSEFLEICKDEECDKKEFDFAFKKLRLKQKENKVIEECIREAESDPLSKANKKIRIQEETKVNFKDLSVLKGFLKFLNLKANLEKKNKASESDSYDIVVKNLKDKKSDKFYWPKNYKRGSEYEEVGDYQTFEKKELEKMKIINDQVKRVNIVFSIEY